MTNLKYSMTNQDNQKTKYVKWFGYMKKQNMCLKRMHTYKTTSQS